MIFHNLNYNVTFHFDYLKRNLIMEKNKFKSVSKF